MADSLAELVREIVNQTVEKTIATKVDKVNPLKLILKDNSEAIIYKESVIIPDHITLKKGDTAYLEPYSENTYLVSGKGK